MIRHLAFITAAIIMFLPHAQAGKVVNVKGKKVYILFDQSEGGTFAEGDMFYLTEAGGKKKAIVQLKKIQGLKVIGQIKKGKATKGFGTLFKSAGAKGAFADESSSESKSSSGGSRYNRMQSHWGAMFGYGTAGQDVNQGDSTSSQDGSSMAVRGVYDYPILENVALRGMGGFELFSVSGQGKPSNSTALATVGSDITYLTLDGVIKYAFVNGSSMSVYGFAGAGFFYPMSKSSDVILEDSIESLAVGEFGLGMDFAWGKWIIPVDFTYFYFPSGEDVETSLMSLKVGIMF